MGLCFGVRPFDFPDFVKMIETGKFDLNQMKYIDVLKRSMQNEFHHFEITSDLMYVLPGLITSNTIRQINQLKAKNNYTCSVHLPLWSIELASPNAYIKQASVECIIESIERTAPLNPICWIIHATGSLIAELSRLDLPS
ncbi:MAG: hypothetical protein ACFE95_13230, partial [Candidatus Hodarchaeota archaeon]